MPHLMGRGRYRSETYPQSTPSSSSSSSCVVQVGSDMPQAEVEVPEQSVGSTPYPNGDGSGGVLTVSLPNAVRGNYIEVQWTATLANPNVSTVEFSAIPVIAFVPTPTFPADYFSMSNGQAGETIPGTEGNQILGSMAGQVMCRIPAGESETVQVTVLLAYHSEGGDLSGGGITLTDNGTATTLKATEYKADCVSQPGPGVLLPLGG